MGRKNKMKADKNAALKKKAKEAQQLIEGLQLAQAVAKKFNASTPSKKAIPDELEERLAALELDVTRIQDELPAKFKPSCKKEHDDDGDGACSRGFSA